MAQVEYIKVKNASRATLNKLRNIGIEKARRIQQVKESLAHGEDTLVETIQL